MYGVKLGELWGKKEKIAISRYPFLKKEINKNYTIIISQLK